MTLADDVAVLLGRDLTDAEEDRADRLIEIAIGNLESALPGFQITPGSETVTLRPALTGSFWTPKYPVTAVDSLAIGGVTVPSANFGFTELGKITVFSSLSYVINAASWFDDYWGDITIAYDYGIADTPADIAGVIANAVASVIRRDVNLADNVVNESESLGAYSHSVTYQSGDSSTLNSGVVLGALPRRWNRSRFVTVGMEAAWTRHD